MDEIDRMSTKVIRLFNSILHVFEYNFKGIEKHLSFQIAPLW